MTEKVHILQRVKVETKKNVIRLLQLQAAHVVLDVEQRGPIPVVSKLVHLRNEVIGTEPVLFTQTADVFSDVDILRSFHHCVILSRNLNRRHLFVRFSTNL